MNKPLLSTLAGIALVGASAGVFAHGMRSAESGHETTVVGEVLDMDCFMAKGAHGADHQDCAVMCLNNGAPVGLLTKDGKAYFLTANEKKGQMKYYNNVRGWGGDQVEITGVFEDRAGTASIQVDGAKKL